MAEVFQLDVKDHMALDKLESMGNIPASLQSVQCNSEILHLFGNGICPEGGSRASVNGQGILYQLWQRNIVLVGRLQVLDVASFHQ